MRGGSKLLSALVLVVVLTVPPPIAGAHVKVHKDPKDVKGQLDIQASMISHKKGEVYRDASGSWPILVASSMHSGEDLDLNALAAPNSLIFNFDTDRDGVWERAVGIYYQDEVLLGMLIKNKNGKPKQIGWADTDMKFGALQAFFPKSALGFKGHRKIAWKVVTNYRDGDKCSKKCFDYAPSKKGWYEHRL